MVSLRFGGLVAVAASMVLMSSGCAQLITRSTVEIVPRNDATPLVIGPPGGVVSARGVSARWTQDGDRLSLRLLESRTCQSVRHVPVVRIERVNRKTSGGAMWFEYGLGAGALALGLSGLIVPERFSQGSITLDGEVVEDKSAGYRIGGIFTGIGVILLTAAVVDTVRTRDEVVYSDAYRRDVGGTIECRDPQVPLRAENVELLVDEWSTAEPTDAEGRIRFLLPTVEDLPKAARDVIEATAKWDAAMAEANAVAAKAAEDAKAAAEAEAAKKNKRRGKKAKTVEGNAAVEPVPEPGAALGPRPAPFVVKGVLRIDQARALAVDFVVPYESDVAKEHVGELSVEPAPSVNPPPKGREAEPQERTGSSNGGQALDLSSRSDGESADDSAAPEPSVEAPAGSTAGPGSKP